MQDKLLQLKKLGWKYENSTNLRVAQSGGWSRFLGRGIIVFTLKTRQIPKNKNKKNLSNN